MSRFLNKDILIKSYESLSKEKTRQENGFLIDKITILKKLETFINDCNHKFGDKRLGMETRKMLFCYIDFAQKFVNLISPSHRPPQNNIAPRSSILSSGPVRSPKYAGESKLVTFAHALGLDFEPQKNFPRFQNEEAAHATVHSNPKVLENLAKLSGASPKPVKGA